MKHSREIYVDIDGQKLIKETFADGDIEYTNKQDQLHRLDGPAYIWSDGTEVWYKDDKLHREDGPAVIWDNGEEDYWLNDEKISKRDIDLLWLKRMVEE